MDFDHAKPIYLQIIDYIKKQIIRGDLKIGDKIPSQRELAQTLKVNPNTVQRAYREMENMHLTETIRGQGTFILEKKELLEALKTEMAETLLKNFIIEMKSLGYENKEVVALVEKYQKNLEEGVSYHDRV
ncbi:GntR family transcriptional regulator [Clostridium formicaceticum]|uniref:GntR family transcriptional regulator n=1 Tax=Clostridium formicaceticum TaxID=1497 RepID=A0AAC9WGB4_9CLOT|nr:GntR family transcriptional regulator [Clostridium formicaceticum]ARE87661.1 HTH-type transcriptional repressor YtrA [Clostridium formicaceticum]